MAGLQLKVPSINQLVTLSIALVVLFFILKIMPEQVKTLFRV